MQIFLRVSLLLTLLIALSQLRADEPAPMNSTGDETAADRGKTILETPIKSLVSPSPNTIQPLLISPSDPPGFAPTGPQLEYVPKARIESSTKRIVDRTAPIGQPPANPSADAVPAIVPDFRTLRMPRLDVGKGFIERPLEELIVLPNGTQDGDRSVVSNPVGPLGQDESQSTETPASDAPVDRRKKVIEASVENLVVDDRKYDIEIPVKNALRAEPDSTKRLVIEAPVTEVVAEESADDTRESNALFSEEVASDDKPIDDNPHVEPGLVKWHGSFEDAKAAAKESGKPVLLFHLMGQLDQRFT